MARKKAKKVYKYQNGKETKYSGFKISGYQKKARRFRAKGKSMKEFGY